MAKHLALIGMMGSGKSSVAPLLGAALGRTVVEVDGLLVEREGLSVSEIFLEKGEAYFRRIEAQLIERLVQAAPAVLSLGGGAFLGEATRTLLLRETVVFYLRAEPETLQARLQEPEAALRPLLQSGVVDILGTLTALVNRRDSTYSLAPFQVATDGHTVTEVAEAILTQRAAYE